MPYLSAEDIALLTQMPARAEVVSPAVLVSQIGAAVSGGFTGLLTAFAGNQLDAFKSKIGGYLGKNIRLAIEMRTADYANIPNLIESELGSDYNVIIDLIKAGIGQGVGGIHGSLFETLNGVSALTSSYLGMIQRVGIDPYIARWVNNAVQPNLFSTETAWFLKRLGKIQPDQYTLLATTEGWNSVNSNLLGESWTQPPPMSLIYEMRRRGIVDDAAFKQMLRYFRLSEDSINKLAEIIDIFPEPYRVADMYAKGIVSKDKVTEAFGAYGLSPDWSAPFADAQFVPPSISLLFELLWRGIIDKTVFDLMLTRSALHPAVRDGIGALAEQIPPAADIITMVVREAFEEANILSAPTDFSGWIAKKGYSSYWADKYWTAHFLPIPLRQGYDNLRRGLWDEAKFKDALRIADIHPRWHQDIVNVAFVPPSIRELGYGFDVGAFTEEDIVKYRRWGGLSEVDAVKSARSLVDYRLEAERNSLRTGNMNRYINGQITKDVFKESLVTLRTNPQAIELWLQRGDLMIELKKTDTSLLEPKNVTRSDVQWLFENGLRNEAWFTTTLTGMGFIAESVTAYLDQSKKKIADRIANDAKITIKQLSIGQITELFYANIITEQDLVAKITSLNYSDLDAQAIAQIIVKARPPREKQFTVTQLAQLFYEGILSPSELGSRLKSMGYSQPDVTFLLELIDLSIPTVKAPPTLSMTDLVQLYKFGYYDERELIQTYVSHGYSEDDATLKGYLSMLEVKIPMLTAQYRNGWMNDLELHSSIGALSLPFITIGIPEKRLQEMMMAIVKNTKVERVVKERDLTKAEILKGAKNGILTPAQSNELLVQLGYDMNEANYLLALNGIMAAGDPRNYWHMRQATEAYRKSQGLPAVDIPVEMVDLEEQRKQLVADTKKAQTDKKTDVEIGELLVKTANTEASMFKIKSKLNIK